MRGKKVMAVTLCALLLFGVLSFAFISMGQQAALADEATFYTTASDGYLIGFNNSSYSAAHDAANAFSWDSDIANRLDIGQFITPSGYNIIRSALFFDTSSLPDTAVITAATLSLYGYLDASQTDFDITVVDGSLLNDPIVAGDYGYLLNQTTSGGVFNTSGFSTSGYNDIPLNATGMGWISKTGMTQFGLRSSRDITANGTLPFGEWVAVYSYEQGVGYRPQLNVSYDTAPPTPTVTPTPTLTPTPTVTPTIPPTPTDVPTLSQWGMIGMAIVLAAFLVWSIRRRWAVRTGKS
jgi:hypothetical protein